MPQAPTQYVRSRPFFPAGELPALLSIVAPAGFGKSAALAHIRAEAGVPAVWYNLDATDADVAGLFGYLVAGFREHLPTFGSATSAMISSGTYAPEALAATLLAELEDALLPGFLIVLEDLHAIGAAGPVHAAIAFLIDELPPRGHLAISSRQRLPFPMARYKATGRAVELTSTDLALSPEEQALFWEARLGRPSPPEGVAALAASLEGWPLGLEMLARLGSSAAASAAPEELFDVLVEEFYAGQPEEIQAFLLQSSLLESFEPGALRDIFGLSDPESAVKHLHGQGLLVRIGGEETYRYHALFREVLERLAGRAHAPDVLADWHRAAGDYYTYEAPELALHHYLAAREEIRALEVGAQAFPALWGAGRVETISRWLERLNPDLAAIEPAALLWAGRLAERRGEASEARSLFQDAHDRCAERGDAAGQFAALVRLTNLAASQGDDESFALALDQALPLLEGARPGDRCDMWLAQALIAERHGSLATAEAYNREVLDVPTGGDPDVAHAHGTALLNMAAYAANRGDASAAKSWLTTLLELADRHELHALRAPALLYRGLLQLQSGDLSAVGDTIASLPGRWETELSWQDAALAHELAAGLALARREWPQTREHLAHAERIYERVGAKHGLRGVADGHVRLAGRQGLYEEARRYFESCMPFHDDDPFDQQLQLSYATVQVLRGEGDAAAEVLARVVPQLPHDSRHQRARGLLLWGLASGDTETLSEGVALVADGGFHYLLVEEEGLYPRLASALAPLGAGAAALEVASARFGVAPTSAPPAVGAFAPDEQLSVRCFGTMEVAVGARAVTDWSRRKAKVLLALLLLYPRGLHRTDLARALYGETSGSEGNLRPVISALRGLLEPDLAPRAPSRYILLADEHYKLDREAIAYLDVAEFDALRERAERARLGDRPDEAASACRDMAALYREELLSESFMGPYFEAERERYRRETQLALRFSATHHLERGELEPAFPALQRLIALDPLAEEDVWLLIQAHHRQGAEELARFAYWDYRNQLKRAVGETPSAEFERRYRELSSP